MPTVTLFNSTVPATSSIVVDGNDLIIEITTGQRFPHFTFHANSVHVNNGVYTLNYAGSQTYHVALRAGVYVGRVYTPTGWADNPHDTTTNFRTELNHARSYIDDLEPALIVV